VSALVACADEPRAVVLALHGGNSGKEYFDNPLDPALSLLRIGPTLGCTVVALDRPGYGSGAAAGGLPAAARTELLLAALDAALEGTSTGGGVLIVGQSMGCVSALRMAVADRDHRFLGVELSGTGLRHTPAVRAAKTEGLGAVRGPSLGRLIWGADDLYPPGTRQLLSGVSGPSSEYEDAVGWGIELAQLAPRVAVPMRYTLAEYESWWWPGREGLAEVAALFTAAPVVETAIEMGAGHNISLGRTARAYHLRVLAFAEFCLARRPR
jgi:pimeloyl-ACP methyl ester carboxylesterase